MIPFLGSVEHGASKNLVTAVRRDITFVWHAMVAMVFVGFAGLAVAAALIDFLSINP